MKKNQYGLWEMYITGEDFELGYKKGILADSLIRLQEEIFIKSIREFVPSNFYLNILKYFVSWFNRNIDKHVPEEYLKEIYGVSLFACDEFNFVGPPYQRMLNYHAAHDIGHALQNMNLVACTAFKVKGDRSKDSTMIIGRNMDFSSGDDFAENKIIAFYKPKLGNNFCFITWAGMIGVISGMNDKGLVITLNAAKSEIPTSAKTPVSILARKVLQYASDISEAYEIIANTEVFVSELFLVGSAVDNKTVIIEKSLEKTGVYETSYNSLIATNHYQSDELKNSELNIESINEGSSLYRWKRVDELLNKKEKHDVESFAAMLRNQKGLNDKDIGMGNEKAINQLIAHHSVIFKPEKLKIWVAVNPYQLGKYLCYDLNEIFYDDIDIKNDVFVDSLTIHEDSFLYDKEYQNFIKYKEMTDNFKYLYSEKKANIITQKEIEYYKQLNPDFYYTYYMAGEYYRLNEDYDKAKKYYKISLLKKIPRLVDKQLVESKLEKVIK